MVLSTKHCIQEYHKITLVLIGKSGPLLSQPITYLYFTCKWMLPAMCSLNKMPLVLHATIRTSLSKRTVGRLCIHISFSGGYLVSNFGHRVISQEIFSFYFSILFKFKWTCLFEYLIVAHLVKKFQILMNTVMIPQVSPKTENFLNNTASQEWLRSLEFVNYGPRRLVEISSCDIFRLSTWQIHVWKQMRHHSDGVDKGTTIDRENS